MFMNFQKEETYASDIKRCDKLPMNKFDRDKLGLCDIFLQ